MSIITKSLIWTEIETLEFVIKLAEKNNVPESHPFMLDLREYKKRIEQDLIKATE